MTYLLGPDAPCRPLQREAVLSALVFRDPDRRAAFMGALSAVGDLHLTGAQQVRRAAFAFADCTPPHDLARFWAWRLFAEQGAT